MAFNCRRAFRVGNCIVKVAEGDIGRASTDAVVNAGNESSFTPLDSGISGALRNACAPDDVVGKEKVRWDDSGNPLPPSKKLKVGHAGAQPAGGRLASQGVAWIVHAVGPRWSDHPVEEATFGIVRPQIFKTGKRALLAASKCGATSVTLPALSGGIFTHHACTAEMREAEQLAAREELVRAVDGYISADAAGSLKEIVLIDLPAQHKASRIDLLMRVTEACASGKLAIKNRWRPLSDSTGSSHLAKAMSSVASVTAGGVGGSSQLRAIVALIVALLATGFFWISRGRLSS
mmetsp:Transcript_37500/g.84568  ORF Transcript_37500/g.84568 Transcript_37500/m.84568 type:complete len:291 (-) Transcript_37500:319-1191(-)